jgi:predicted CopG family antitoxin
MLDRTDIMLMKTIQIRKGVKRRLDTFADGKSINKAMRELLSDVDTVEPVQCSRRADSINIHMDDDLLVKLRNCKRYSHESHSEVISRLLSDKGF